MNVTQNTATGSLLKWQCTSVIRHLALCNQIRNKEDMCIMSPFRFPARRLHVLISISEFSSHTKTDCRSSTEPLRQEISLSKSLQFTSHLLNARIFTALDETIPHYSASNNSHNWYRIFNQNLYLKEHIITTN